MNTETINNDRKNSEGYDDPTVFAAMKSMQNMKVVRKDSEDYIRFKKLLKMIFEVCELADFHVEGRITLKDRKTGKIWN